ncbi:MAG: hypothetical protein AAF242_05675 [Bacteroidota bacterium]
MGNAKQCTAQRKEAEKPRKSRFHPKNRINTVSFTVLKLYKDTDAPATLLHVFVFFTNFFIDMNYLPATFLLLLLSCSPKVDQTSEIYLSKALNLLSETLKTEEALKPLLANLEQEKNSIQIQGRALSEEEMQRIAAIDQLQKDYADWDAKLILIPGFETQIRGDRAAGYQTPNNLKAKELYELQQKSRETLGKILARAKELSE